MPKSVTTFFKEIYGTPTAEALALRELENAKRSLLEAQSAKEYAESMVKYHDARIKLLTTYLREARKEKENEQQ